MSTKKENKKNFGLVKDKMTKETEQMINDGELLVKRVDAFIDKLGLQWSFKSIDVVNKKYKTSLGQLRSCVYVDENDNPIYDVFKSLRLIIVAGLVHTGKDTDELDEEAFNIIEQFRVEIGNIGVLHIKLTELMEENHFFIDGQDRKMLVYLTKRAMSKGVGQAAVAHLNTDQMERMRQLEALNSIY